MREGDLGNIANIGFSRRPRGLGEVPQGVRRHGLGGRPAKDVSRAAALPIIVNQKCKPRPQETPAWVPS